MLSRCSCLSSVSITCRCEIPMQLPILYSMSSSGEVTLALHGWQRTFLQNCILVVQTKHCQSSQISARTCLQCVAQWLMNALALPSQSVHPRHTFPGHLLHKNFNYVRKIVPRMKTRSFPLASHLPRISARLCTVELWREEFPPEEREGGREKAIKCDACPFKKKKKDPGDEKHGVSSRLGFAMVPVHSSIKNHIIVFSSLSQK